MAELGLPELKYPKYLPPMKKGGASEEEEEETCLIETGDNDSGAASRVSTEAIASKVLVGAGSGSESSINDKNRTRNNRRISPAMSDGEEDAERPNPLLQNDVLNLAKTIMGVSKDDEGQLPPAADLEQLTLHQIARDGNEGVMAKALERLTGNKRRKVNEHDDEDLSPLHYAARYNHVKIVQLLVHFGADVNDTDKEGAAPLHFAARYKRMRVTENLPSLTSENSVILFLVAKGAKVNVGDIYGCTPLHYAAMRGNEIATVEFLSCEGIHVEAQDNQHMTALHLAASHNELAICRMLIEKGANIRCNDEGLATPLHYACMEGNLELVELLFEAACKIDDWVTVTQMLKDQDNQQDTPLHLAVEHRSFEVAKLCIEKGASVNLPRSNYQTPLHLAAKAGDLQITKLLVEKGARIDALDIDLETPLYKASSFNHADVVEYLLDQGANINRRDKDSFSPLLIAACSGHAETVKLLLDRGANYLDKDKNDKTALFWAAEEDKQEVIKILQEYEEWQELLTLCDRYDNSPLHIACQNGYIACANLLLDSGADIDAKNEEEATPLHLAAANGKALMVRELVSRHRNIINDEDEDSNTPLHLAALAGHIYVAETLIKCGADIQARNATLWTPLDCAAAEGHTKVCGRLLDAGAPVDPMDKAKITPLHLASTRGHIDVVNLLLKSDANAGLRGTDGKNCLDLAIENGHRDVATAIVNSTAWETAMRNSSLNLGSGNRDTPMRKLIKKMPTVAQRVLTRCIIQNKANSDHSDYEVTFNFEFLDDMFADWKEGHSDAMSSSGDSAYDEDGKIKQGAQPYSSDATVLKMNHPLTIMVQEKREDLLAHPLVTALLQVRWNSYGRYFYYANLLFYCIFLTFLTGYICTARPPFVYYRANGTNHENWSSYSECAKAATISPMQKSWSQTVFVSIGQWIIIVICCVRLFGEIVQMANAKLSYFVWENFVEWITYIFTLLLVIDVCQTNSGIRMAWQWQIGAVAIFMAWITLVLFIQKIPKFGIYVVMFIDVFTTFVNFFPVFFLFIIAFALAFYALLQNQPEFDTPAFSLLKTSVMMIGEFEFADIFLAIKDFDDKTVTEAFVHRIFYSPATYTIFILFMIIMTILIMNLLVGLAVDDIKAVQEQAVLKRLAMQVELVLDVARVLPMFIQRRFLVKSLNIKPNKGSNRFGKRLSDRVTSQKFAAAIKPEKSEMEKLEDNQDRMMGYINNLRLRLKGIGEKQKRMESMMEAMLKANNVEFEINEEAEMP